MIVVSDLKLSGVKHIQLNAFSDERGFFVETYRKALYEKMGIDVNFVQDNHSFSKKGTIRGMHFSKSAQAKLITVMEGTIYDVFVDIRPDSPTFGKWGSRELNAQRQEQLYIPAGFAHGFAVMSPTAHVFYKVSTFFNPKTEKTFRFDDPNVGIKWPFQEPILSQKDRCALNFHEVVK